MGVPSGTKSPGTVSGPPYTNSAVDAPKSSFGAVRIPSRTQGSSSIQFGPVSRHFREAFKSRWLRSTSPLACGWYAVVGCNSHPSKLHIEDHNSDVNCAPLSEVIDKGTPNRATQLCTNARATVRVSMFLRGMASGQRENRSTIVRR